MGKPDDFSSMINEQGQDLPLRADQVRQVVLQELETAPVQVLLTRRPSGEFLVTVMGDAPEVLQVSVAEALIRAGEAMKRSLQRGQ